MRTHHADGTDVDDGPAVSSTYPLGYFREDYEFIANSAEDYLDEHNGRFCVTPEYPNGTYAYFCTVDEDWNSAYPYAVGPTFYGTFQNRLVTSVDETTTVYTAEENNDSTTTDIANTGILDLNISIFPNPSSDLLAIQISGLLNENMQLELLDLTGKQIMQSQMNKGQTIAYFDVQTLYEGTYLLRISNPKTKQSKLQKVIVQRN